MAKGRRAGDMVKFLGPAWDSRDPLKILRSRPLIRGVA